MRKVVIIVCFIAGFLLLMVPNVNAIEYQNQKKIITSEIETMDYSFVKMVKQTPKNEWQTILKYIIQIIIKLIHYILVTFSTIFNITKTAISFLFSSVLHIIKTIFSLLLFMILAVVFIFIAMNVILIIILIIWVLTSSLPQSYYISYEFEKLINSIKQIPN